MVDPWEGMQPAYVETAKVLDHFDHEVNEVLGGVIAADGTHKRVKVTTHHPRRPGAHGLTL